MKPAIQQFLARITRHGTIGETDSQLVSRFVRDRDQTAFAAILDHHGRLVWGVCRGLLLNEADAEDAFQATFVALYRGAAKIRQQASLAPWLHATATRIAKKTRMSAARRTRRELRAARPESAPGPVSDEAWESLNVALHDEVARLPERLRVAFVMCVLEGKRQEDAATQLGVPVGTLSARVSRARARLLERLNARGQTPAIAVAIGTASAGAAVPKPLLTLVRHQSANGFVSVPRPVRNLAAAGGSSMTMKWIGATVVSALLLAALVAWSLWPTPNVTAAPALPPTDKGVIWVYHPKPDNTATFTAYTPEGRKVEEVKITKDDCYLGITPDGQKIAFFGKDGKVAESRDAEGLTVHLRDIGNENDVTDTGIPAGKRYSYAVWSRDMKQVIYGRVTALKDGVFPLHKFSLIDLATKVETPLDLPASISALEWSRDGKWLLVAQSSDLWQRYTLADGKLQTLVTKRYFYMDLSPDGKSLIGYGPTRDGVVGGPHPPYAVNRFNVETGAMTIGDKWVRRPNDMLVMSKWSLDGKRVAHAVRERDQNDPEGVESHRLVVCDPDGGNEVELFAKQGQFMGFIFWLPSRQTK